jgi:hypothetical protein
MLIKEIGIPALQAGILEELCGPKIEGDYWKFLKKDFFGFLESLHAFGT